MMLLIYTNVTLGFILWFLSVVVLLFFLDYSYLDSLDFNNWSLNIMMHNTSRCFIRRNGLLQFSSLNSKLKDENRSLGRQFIGVDHFNKRTMIFSSSKHFIYYMSIYALQIIITLQYLYYTEVYTSTNYEIFIHMLVISWYLSIIWSGITYWKYVDESRIWDIFSTFLIVFLFCLSGISILFVLIGLYLLICYTVVNYNLINTFYSNTALYLSIISSIISILPFMYMVFAIGKYFLVVMESNISFSRKDYVLLFYIGFFFGMVLHLYL